MGREKISFGIMSLFSRRIFRSFYSEIGSPYLYSNGFLNNFNGFHQPQLDLCFVGHNMSNEVTPWTMMDYLSTGTMNISGQKLMERWNRRLKQHGIRVKLSKR